MCNNMHGNDKYQMQESDYLQEKGGAWGGTIQLYW